jgi:hypothetical protein
MEKNNQPVPHARKSEEQFTILGKTMQPEAKELRFQGRSGIG